MQGANAIDPRYAGAGQQIDEPTLGVGATGEVTRARDPRLRRELARKILHRDLAEDPEAVARFVEEAELTAQLQHPGILPVHELGATADGRPWFTMKEVRGRTLRALLDAPERGPLRRLIGQFSKACEAVSYAHSRGVIHRDLKPDNIMIGEFGEVLVLDWGLARVLGEAPGRARAQVRTARQEAGRFLTQQGEITGTPVYMPPEQARGEIDRLDARADVYALGAILYELAGGRPPYAGDAVEVLIQVIEGPPAPLGPGVPRALRAVCERAMAREPAGRYADAGALVDALAAWLEGAERRALALEVVAEADALAAQARALREWVQSLRDEASALLAGVERMAPSEQKRAGWAKQDAAQRLEGDAAALETRWLQTLRSALNHDPALTEAHERLAAHYREAHAAAEAQRDVVEARRAEVLLRAHAARAAKRADYAAWLDGRGALTLVTEPPGAEALLYRYETIDRRLEPVFERSLGDTPLRAEPLPMGSYLVILKKPGFEDVRYPVRIRRQEHWDGIPPGGREPAPIPLPPAGALGPDAVYVPPGWFSCGGDEKASQSVPRARVWLDGFAIQRFATTNAEYLEYLNDLVRAGQEDEALARAPQMAARENQQLHCVGRRPDGTFELIEAGLVKRAGVWRPDWPVVYVDRQSAGRYAAWRSERDGATWRLPWEMEWEKAARGVDERLYPWGDFADPTWCLNSAHFGGQSHPMSVRGFPLDVSPYGVRGLSGSARGWCLDRYTRDGSAVPGGRPRRDAAPWGVLEPTVVLRGSWYGGSANYARSAVRVMGNDPARHQSVGARLVREISWG